MKLLAGRYRVVRLLGEGGMGAVHEAVDETLQRTVAIKVLGPQFLHDADVKERFEREGRLMAQLDHPNLVPLYDVGADDGRPFLVMKKLDGQTLAEHLKTKGGFTRDETLKLMRQLAAGLDYLHSRGFIHRDVKAANIFLGPDGQATLLDFGILRPRSGKDVLTRQSVVMGTPHYMAPEQALGATEVDHKVDLYALAVVLFECLSGALPFEADSELKLIQLQAHTPAPDVAAKAPWIPKAVGAVVARALAKRPEDRFGSGAELVKALESAWVAESASHAAPPAKAPAVSPSTAPSWRNREAPVDALPPPVSTPPPSRLRPFIAMAVVASALTGGIWLWLDSQPKPVPPPDDFLVVDPGSRGVKVPLVAPVVVDAGQVVVVPVVRDAGVVAVKRPVVFDAGLVAVVIDAGPSIGELRVISTRAGESFWAQVRVDGVDKGRTPLKLELGAGSHVVEVERSGFRQERREVQVVAGKPAVLSVDLAQAP